MKFKMRYALIPACITFGPFFMSDMGGLGSGSWGIPMMGTIMVVTGLGGMLSMIGEQRIAIEALIKQCENAPPNNTRTLPASRGATSE